MLLKLNSYFRGAYVGCKSATVKDTHVYIPLRMWNPVLHLVIASCGIDTLYISVWVFFICRLLLLPLLLLLLLLLKCQDYSAAITQLWGHFTKSMSKTVAQLNSDVCWWSEWSVPSQTLCIGCIVWYEIKQVPSWHLSNKLCQATHRIAPAHTTFTACIHTM